VSFSVYPKCLFSEVHFWRIHLNIHLNIHIFSGLSHLNNGDYYGFPGYTTNRSREKKPMTTVLIVMRIWWKIHGIDATSGHQTRQFCTPSPMIYDDCAWPRLITRGDQHYIMVSVLNGAWFAWCSITSMAETLMWKKKRVG
jgi:hypothetical protein